MPTTTGIGIPVSYTDQFNIWPHCQAEFRSFLPLRNVELKTLNINPTSLRTNQSMLASLDLDLQKFSAESWHVPVRSNSAFNFPKNGPYLHLYFVNCDEETYKQVIKKEIRQWIDTISTRRHHEWIIVFVSQERKEGLPGMQASKASLVFEKIKTEFNTARRDRCIYVKIDENNSWADLFESILDGLASSFGSLLTQAQEDVRKMDSQRLIPGFNFCNFFMLKEGLAEAYECLGMHEEAYLTYHELDAAFFQCVDSAMQKDTSPWSENYGATEPGDDSVDITSSTCKSYHSRLADNTISIFDFRNYSFARQCHLMVRLGRPVEICTRARWHIGISVRSLRQRNFARFFIPSWIYSACMSVVKLTDWLVHSLNMGNNSMFFARYDAAKVGLLHEARRQLDVLGKEFGYLKCFVDPLICETDTQIDGSQQPIGITNPDLLNLMQSRQEFNERYVAQTEHLIKIYESSLNYQNAARLLRCDLGSLWFYSGQWREAAKVFLHCIDWPLISGERGVDGSIIMEEPFSAGGSERRLPQMNLFEIDALLKWCRTSRELQNSLLHLQQCSLLLANHDLLSAAQIEYCLKALRSEELSTFLTINSKGLLNFTIEQTAIGKDCTLEALVRSLISVPVNLDRILVVVYGPGGFEATFQSDQLPLLTYGEQVSITLRCPTTTPNGSYVLGHCVASIGRLQLKTSFMELGKTKQNIQIGRHPDAVNLTIYRPPVWHANEAFPDDLAYTALVTEFLVSIHSNSGAIAAGSLVKLSTDPFIILADDNYQLKANINRLPSAAGNQRTTVENVLISGQSIQLDFPIEAGSVVQIAVPFIVDIATPAESVATAFKVYCSFEYRSTASAPAVTICQSEAMISLRNDLSLRSFIVQQTSNITTHVCYEIRNECRVPIRLLGTRLYETVEPVAIKATSTAVLFPGQSYRAVAPLIGQDGPEKSASIAVFVDYRRIDFELFDAIYEVCSTTLARESTAIDMHNPAAFLAHCLYQLSLPNEQASDLILREFAAHEQAVLSPRSASEYRAAAAAWNGRLGAVYGQNSGEWDLIWNELLVTSTTGESQSPAARLFDVIVKENSIIQSTAVAAATGGNKRLQQLQYQAQFSVRNPMADAVTTVEIYPADSKSFNLTVNAPHRFIIRLLHKRRSSAAYSGPLYLNMTVVPDHECWMIAGPVKQRLCVTPGSRQEIPYTFIPLQTGAVTMPALDLVETVANTAIDGTAAAISLSHEIVVRNHWRRPNVLPSRSAAVFWIADKEVRRPALGAQSEAANTGELLLAVEESSGSQQQAGVANASIIRSQSVISFGTPALDTMANPNGVPGGSIQRPPQTPIPLERIAETPLSAAVGDLLSPAFIKSMTSSLNVRNFRPRRGWWATSTNALGELKGQMQRAIDRRPFVTGQQQQTTASPKPTNSPTGSKAVTTPATASPTEENIVLQ